MEARNACPMLARWSGSVVTATSCLDAWATPSISASFGRHPLVDVARGPTLKVKPRFRSRPIGSGSLSVEKLRYGAQKRLWLNRFWQEGMAAMALGEHAARASTQPQERHICAGQSITDWEGHHPIQINIENSRIGHPGFQCGERRTEGGKRSKDPVALFGQHCREMHGEKRIVFHNHDA